MKDIIRTVNPKGGFLSQIPDGRPSPADYEIVYAVITKPTSDWPRSLPFFSQLNLMQQAKLLRGLGFKVALQQVKEI